MFIKKILSIWFISLVVLISTQTTIAIENQQCLFDLNLNKDFKTIEHHFISNDFKGNSRMRLSVIFEKREDSQIYDIKQEKEKCEKGVVWLYSGIKIPLNLEIYDKYGIITPKIIEDNKNKTTFEFRYPSIDLEIGEAPIPYSLEIEQDLPPEALKKINRNTFTLDFWGGINIFPTTDYIERTISLPDNFLYSSKIISVKPTPTYIYDMGQQVNLFYSQEDIEKGRNALFIKFEKVPNYTNWLLLFLAILSIILVIIQFTINKKKITIS